MVRSIMNIDASVQKTEGWLTEVMMLLNWDDKRQAMRALRVVLHLMRDRLPIEEATDLGAELPLVMRGMYYEGYNPHNKPERMHRKEFLDRVWLEFNRSKTVDVEGVVRAVLMVVQRHISIGEIRDIKGNWPEDLRRLWPSEEETELGRSLWEEVEA